MLTLLALMTVATATPIAKPPATAKCLQTRDSRGQRLSPEDGLFVQTQQGWWRNTGPACPLYGQRRQIVAPRLSSTLCAGDVVNIIDNFSRIAFGACTIGSWEKVAAKDVPPAFNN